MSLKKFISTQVDLKRGSRGHSTGFGTCDKFCTFSFFFFLLFLLYVKLTSTLFAVCVDLRLLSFVVFTYQSAAPSYRAVIWLENSIRDFHVFYFNARLHKRHQRCNHPLTCTYIKLDSSLKVNYFRFKKLQISRWKGNREARFCLLSLRCHWDPRPPHSIVCHHAVCCGQMNQESRDTLLLFWRCTNWARGVRHFLPIRTRCRRRDGQRLPSIIPPFSWLFEVPAVVKYCGGGRDPLVVWAVW